MYHLHILLRNMIFLLLLCKELWIFAILILKLIKNILPEAICIDEFKSVKNIDGAMSFVFADYQSKSIIDIVEDR